MHTFREPVHARLRFSIMMIHWVASLLVAIPITAIASITTASRVPYLPVPKGAAVILNTGSTNSAGYRIVIQPDGSAEYVVASTPQRASIPTEQAHRFFADLAAAMPLHELPSEPCMKSVSFGTSLFVWWSHSRSPDLSCPSDARGRTLRDDAEQVAQALKISGLLGPVMRPMLPNEQHRALPQPSTSPSPTP